MISGSSCSYHCLGTMTGISTIMQNDREVIVLHFLYDLLNENRRVLRAVLIRQESGSRFGHHYPIHSCGLQCHAVTENEIRTFLQQRIGRFRIDINKHHDFRHVIQTSCQRIRTDATGKDGPVRNGLGRQHIRFQVLGNSSFIQGRNFQFVNSFLIIEKTPHHTGNLIFGEDNLRSESLGFYRQIHNHGCGGCGIFLTQCLDGVVMHLSVSDGIAYRFPYHLYARMGHDGHSHHFFLLDNFVYPLFHIQFTHGLLFFIYSVIAKVSLFFDNLLFPLLFLIQKNGINPVTILQGFTPFFIL